MKKNISTLKLIDICVKRIKFATAVHDVEFAPHRKIENCTTQPLKNFLQKSEIKSKWKTQRLIIDKLLLPFKHRESSTVISSS